MSTPIPYRVSCTVESFSHTLETAAFAIFQSPSSSFRASDIHQHSFDLTAVNINPTVTSLDQFAPVAHISLNCFIVALNIVTVGHWQMLSIGSAAPVYTFCEPHGLSKQSSLALNRDQLYPDKAVLRDVDIRRCALLCGALMRDKAPFFRQEYTKGIIHLALQHVEIDFLRDAFANFFRIFEHAATNHILCAKKLKNELRDLQDALSQVGASAELIEEFQRLYKIWSQDVMHAQKIQTPLEQEDALKMKCIADLTCFQIFKPIWEKGIQAMRDREA